MNTKKGNLSDSELMEIAAKRIKQLEREADSKGFKSYKKYGGVTELWASVIVAAIALLISYALPGNITAVILTSMFLVWAMIYASDAERKRDNGIMLERLEEIEEKL